MSFGHGGGFLGRHGSFLGALGGALLKKHDLMISSLGSLGGPVSKLAQLSLMVPELLSPQYEDLAKKILDYPRVLWTPDVMGALWRELKLQHHGQCSLENLENVQEKKFTLESMWDFFLKSPEVVVNFHRKNNIQHNNSPILMFQNPKGSEFFLEEIPVKWASFSQVHRCFYEGKPYGCKIQYPSMAESMGTHETYIKSLGFFYEKTMGALNFQNLSQDFFSSWRQELNYHREGRFMSWFHKIFQHNAHIHVPKPLFSLCSQKILVMDWKNGHNLFKGPHWENLSKNQRNDLGLLIFKAWLYPLLAWGCLHGDPHKDNIKWFLDSQGAMNLTLLDFGSSFFLGSKIVEDFRRLFYSLKYGDSHGEREIYSRWGVSPLTPQVLDFLHHWCILVFSPFFSSEKKPYKLVTPEDFSKGRALCLKHHEILCREKASLVLPWPLVLLNRMGVLVGSILCSLEAEQPWGKLLENFLEKDQNTLRKLGTCF